MAIKLEKNKGISLKKDNVGLDFIKVGLGWDPEVLVKIKHQKKKFLGLFGSDEYTIETKKVNMNVDIDASVLLFDDKKQFVGECSYRNLHVILKGNTVIKHSGDERSGGKKGDDEVINVYLDELLKTKVCYAYIVLNIFSPNVNFDAIQNAYVNIYDKTNVKLAEYNLTDDYENKNGIIAAKLVKKTEPNTYWEFVALGNGLIDAARIDSIKNRVTQF